MVLFQARHAAELAALVRRSGGDPISAPCMRETPAAEPGVMDSVLVEVRRGVDLAIFQTGVGVARLFDRAGERSGDLAAALNAGTVLARGPKPLAELLKRGIRVGLRTDLPHTTHEILAILPRAPRGRVLVQHHGRRNSELVEALQARGDEVIEVEPYAWDLPEDTAPVLEAIRLMATGGVDAVAFSSAAQVATLWAVAAIAGREEDLMAGLARVLVAAIGPTTREALVEAGVRVDIEPEIPKMVPLVAALTAALR